MKLTATTYDERIALIACGMDALTHAKTDDLEITFVNGYTVSIFVHDHIGEFKATATVHILRKNKVINDSDFICDYPREYNASEVQTLLLNISRAQTDFECGFAYARYIARTEE